MQRRQPCNWRPDWYVATAGEVMRVGEAPKPYWDEKHGCWLLHRSHLPLLGVLPRPPVGVRGVSDILPDGTKLRGYQVEGVKWLRERRGSLLADSCRLGKTACVIGAHDVSDGGKLVVIAPLQVKPVWVNWMNRQWPDEPIAICTGRKYDPENMPTADGNTISLDDARLVIGHYDILPAWASGVGGLRNVRRLVLDEAHLISNFRAKRSQAALMMSTKVDQVTAVTGTPLWNDTAGLWPILASACPGAWGTWTEFTERYASGSPGAHGWTTGDPSEIPELQARLSEVMIARRWQDVVAELPPTVRSVESVKLDPSEARTLDRIAASVRDELIKNGLASMSQTMIGELARLRRIVADKKVPAACDRAARILDEGESVVVWVWHRDVAQAATDRLHKQGYEVFTVTGDVDIEDREPIFEAWRKAGPSALVVSMAVAATGVDFSKTPYCIVTELDWTPAVLGQAVMRTFSPLRPNFEIYVVAEHWIEIKLLEILIHKFDTSMRLGIAASDVVIGDLLVGQHRPANDALDMRGEADLAGLADRIALRVDREKEEFGAP